MPAFQKAWLQIRATAEKLAATTETPSLDEAKALIRRIIVEEGCEMPEAEHMTYLAGELRSLIGHYRGDGTRTTDGLEY